jgi:hypothetical protein
MFGMRTVIRIERANEARPECPPGLATLHWTGANFAVAIVEGQIAKLVPFRI